MSIILNYLAIAFAMFFATNYLLPFDKSHMN